MFQWLLSCCTKSSPSQHVGRQSMLMLVFFMNELIYILRHVLIYQNSPDAIYALSSSNFQTSKDQGDCQEASGMHALAINDCISTCLFHSPLCGRNTGSFPVGGFVSLPPYMLFCKRAFHNPCHCDDSFVGLRIENHFISEENWMIFMKRCSVLNVNRTYSTLMVFHVL